jgi:YcxB-like protein
MQSAVSAGQALPVNVQLTMKEYGLLQAACSTKAPKSKDLWIYKVVCVGFYGSLALLTFVTPWAYFTLIAGWGLIAANRIVRRPTEEVLEAFSGTMTVIADGLNRWTPQRTTTFYWAGITELVQTSEYVLVHFGLTALLIPFRCFGDDDHRHDFLEALQAGMRHQ